MASCIVKKLKKSTRRKLIDYEHDTMNVYSLKRMKRNELDCKHMFSEQSKRRSNAWEYN